MPLLKHGSANIIQFVTDLAGDLAGTLCSFTKARTGLRIYLVRRTPCSCPRTAYLFFHADESIHLSFDRRLVRLVRATIHTAFGLLKPHSISHMFGNWLKGLITILNC